MANSKQTTNHDKIKSWIEMHKGKPAVVKGTEENQEPAGLLRVRFSEESSDDLKEVSWDEFFETFEEKKLAFLYDEGNDDSRFFKFVKR